MNIFATDIDPKLAASNLDSKRVVKMVLESAQMLSTAINEHGRGKVAGPYKTTHKNHPANVWARETRANYMWLLNHFEMLCHEYRVRYDRTHKCHQYLKTFTMCASIIPNGPLTPFANCAAHAGKGISYKHIKPTTKAYQFYLVERWNTDKRKPEWDMRGFRTVYPTWLRIVKDKYFHCEDPTWIALYGKDSTLGMPLQVLYGKDSTLGMPLQVLRGSNAKITMVSTPSCTNNWHYQYFQGSSKNFMQQAQNLLSHNKKQTDDK